METQQKMKAESSGQPSISTSDRFWGTAAKWRKRAQRKEKGKNSWGAGKIRTKDCPGLQPSGCACRGVDLMVWQGTGASLHSDSRMKREELKSVDRDPFSKQDCYEGEGSSEAAAGTALGVRFWFLWCSDITACLNVGEDRGWRKTGHWAYQVLCTSQG